LIVAEIARAKVNLALHVIARRADGYHELDSIVAFADVGDHLTFEPAPSFELAVTGPFAHGLETGKNNLVMRAALALAGHWPERIRPARIGLTKNLPVAAGLGGGSADAAATLRGLIRLSGARVDETELMKLALELGADVPVCLAQRACHMRGIGEDLSTLMDFSALPALLVNPGIPVATTDVFRQLNLAVGATHSGPIGTFAQIASWRNDLEPPARAIAPMIGEVLETLRKLDGIRHAAMSGSGATCFGIFESARTASAAISRVPSTWWSLPAELA
jgi:4-diphosphocytidyl-2-C-methyl-D-erythritol kinase